LLLGVPFVSTRYKFAGGRAALSRLVSFRYHFSMNQSPFPPIPGGPAALAELLRCLSRALHAEARQASVARGLLPIHAQIVGYLGTANRYSNTLQALVEYLGQTKGTVSQSLRLLEQQGLIARRTDPQDRRVVRLSLTRDGERILRGLREEDPWVEALAGLSPAEAAAAARVLAGLLREWQRQRGQASFGVCRGCAHFRTESARRFRCGLTGEALSAHDSTLICREHTLPG
jgi:MarR family transcriptional repressor of emrRAB